MIELYEYDKPLTEYGIDVPEWIEQDITSADVTAIIEGGCASGAYMPAVTYWQALETMNAHGDEVLDYIEEQLGELPSPSHPTSWAGMACHFVSAAVELWAVGIEEEIKDAIEAAEEDE